MNKALRYPMELFSIILVDFFDVMDDNGRYYFTLEPIHKTSPFVA